MLQGTQVSFLMTYVFQDLSVTKDVISITVAAKIQLGDKQVSSYTI
jgi:hypothetical protein